MTAYPVSSSSSSSSSLADTGAPAAMEAASSAITAALRHLPDLYLRSHAPFISDLVYTAANPNLVTKDLAKLVVSYLTDERDCFGVQDWEQYCRVTILPQFRPVLNLYEFYQFWFSRDTMDPSLQVSQTHLPPVLAPQWFTPLGTTTFLPRSLNTLNQLGLRFRENSDSPALTAHRNTRADSSYWLVMRRGVLNSGCEDWDRWQTFFTDLNTHISRPNYCLMPSILDLATILLAFNLRDGERHLGDATGEEGQITFSFCAESVEIPTQIEYEILENVDEQLLFGHFALEKGVDVLDESEGINYGDDDNSARELAGFAAVRRFS